VLQNDIVAEVDKMIVAGFIKEVQYPQWLSSIVPVMKRMVSCGFVSIFII
jgi:hypothetical protein